MPDGWVPFSRRGRDDEAAWHVLHEGVPPHLAPALQSLVQQRLVQVPAVAGIVQRRLRLDLPQDVFTSDGVLAVVAADPNTMLDVIDCLLDEAGLLYAAAKADDDPRHYDMRRQQKSQVIDFAQNLMAVLHEGDSAYMLVISEDGERWCLGRRVDETTTMLAEDGFSHGTPAARLLKAAWAATFRRVPDLLAAYRDVVLAVESVATSTFTPKDPSPSLGKAITHLRDTQATWTVAGLDDQARASSVTLLANLETIWQNHQRHVAQGGHAPEPVEQQEAEAVLFLGITVVQWFERGLVRKI